MLSLKGQLTIEYMLSFLAFIGLMLFIYFQYSSNIPDFMGEADKENSRSVAYQLSEVLLNNPGHPSDWDETSVERVGLSSELENRENLVSLSKIEDVQSLCSSNYENLREKLAFERPFSLYFYEIQSGGARNGLLSCSPPGSLREVTEINVIVRRIATFYDYNDDTVKLGELVIEV